MLTDNERFALVPQLRDYHRHMALVAPYVLFKSEPNFRSEHLTTDADGFRVSTGPAGLVDSTTWWTLPRRGLVLGSSFVFGEGANSDRGTLPSQLNERTDTAYLNLGIRAANSTQQLIVSLPFMAHTHRVIVCSGLNNLVANLQSIGRHDRSGPFFYEHYYGVLAEHPLMDLPDLIRRPLARQRGRDLLRETVGRLRRRLTGHSTTRAPTGFIWQAQINLEEAEERAQRGLEFEIRDLRYLAQLRRHGTALIYVVQPFAWSLLRLWSPEEETLLAQSDDPAARALRDSLNRLWPSYAVALQEVCQEEGIAFLNLNQVEYQGWTFIDAAHMTDEGYRQAAEAIVEKVL